MKEVDTEAMKTYADVEIFNQHDEICVYALHILKFIPEEELDR